MRVRVGLILLVIVLAAGGAFLWLLRAPYARFAAPVLVPLPARSSTWAIARTLHSAGVVRSAVAFEIWALTHPGRTLKAGWYRFTGPESMQQVMERVARGDVFFYALAVPEGFNRFDIARQLERAGIAPAAPFLAATASPVLIRDLDPQAVSLEGFLFPDTYRIPPHATAETIAEMMVHRFRQEWRALGGGVRFAASPQGTGPMSLHEWVTIASLVEKETAQPEERPVVAGIFYHRLRMGLPLQCDPTVIYAAQVAGRPLAGSIHAADLRFASPYNTYVHAGLPPGPIANPGRPALLAAANPVATDFLYFVSNGQGGHRFARTLAEQDRNIALYLRSLAKK